MSYMLRNNIKNIFIGVLPLFCAFFFSTPTALASTGLTIQPIKVSHTMNPGEEVSGFISLTNASTDDNETQVTLKVEDFVPFAGSEGVNFVGRSPGVSTVMDWISLGENNEHVFLVGKNDSRSIPYTIRAPLDAEPGGHYGVLFFKANRTVKGQQLDVGTQVGVLVLVTIPGSHLQKGKILDFTTAKGFYQKSPIDFSIRFENTGTVHFEPKGIITITNIFGKEVGEVPIQGQIVLPTGIRNLTPKWTVEGLLLGKYNAALSIVDGEGEELSSKSISFYVFPVWYILEFIAGIIFVYLLLRYMKKKVRINISLK